MRDFCQFTANSEGLSLNRPESYVATFEEHLLWSNFRDSMEHGSGFPTNINHPSTFTVFEGPILLELVSMTDIGTSALVLEHFRLLREAEVLRHRSIAADRWINLSLDDLAGLRPLLTPYPRNTLKLLLTDGLTLLEAIEFSPLRQFALGTTPLGCKVWMTDMIFPTDC